MNVPFKEVPGSSPIPDVDAIMQRMRAGIAAELGRGALAPAELEGVRRLEHELRVRPDFGPAPADDIARLHASWDPLGPYAFTSHRVGVGRIVVTAKQWLRRLLRPVAAVTLARQGEFNGAVARLLTGACLGVQSLEAGNAALVRRFEELERHNLELLARCDALQSEVRALQARLGHDGHPVQPG